MKIEMLEGPNGKMIPAQKIRTVYVLQESTGKLETTRPLGGGSTYVSHFETCPKASSFTKGKK
jgi:hypothetical protein